MSLISMQPTSRTTRSDVEVTLRHVQYPAARTTTDRPALACQPTVHRTRGWTPRLLALAFVGSLAAGCADAAAPISAAPPQPAERELPPVTHVDEPVDSSGVRRRSLDDLERDLGTRLASSRAWTVDATGAVRQLTAAQLRDELHAPIQRARRLQRQGATDSSQHDAFASPIYSDAKLSIGVYAVVKAEGSHFHFYSMSQVNRTDRVFHRMRGTNSVVAVGENGAQQQVYSKTDSVSFHATGGFASHAWDEFVVTGGCSFLGTASANNEAHWPATGYVPQGVVEVASGSGGGSDTMWKSCSKPTSAPPPPPSEPLCDDDTSATCETPGSGKAPPYSGGRMVREIGHTTRHKIWCEVTDWYENGVYIETTINYCWTEPIW